VFAEAPWVSFCAGFGLLGGYNDVFMWLVGGGVVGLVGGGVVGLVGGFCSLWADVSRETGTVLALHKNLKYSNLVIRP
jgi:hypothetical protein